ncbi:MAG: hypothetical protein JWO44_284 [Bacteroidetes bacterium]|nr:hypothetical protein [Bacteroidota bacterium]
MIRSRHTLLATILFLSLQSLTAFSQKISDVVVQGEIKELSLSPDGSVWLADDGGLVYSLAAGQNNVELKLKLPEPKPDYFGAKHINIERLSFFNEKNFFISGYVGKDLLGKEMDDPNMIYLTNDGGGTWSTVEFCKKGIWVYDCITKGNGEAWLGGSDGNIYYSDDFAKHWKKLSAPYNNSSRMARFALGQSVGLAASLGNKLKLSTDNFKTFSTLETPLEQGKYEDPNKAKPESRSDNRFTGTAVMNDLLIVTQEGYTFYSPKDKIDWTRFKPGIGLFAVDEKEQKVIGISEQNKINVYAKDLAFERELGVIPAAEHIMDIKVLNGTVFILTEDYQVAKPGDDVIGRVGNMEVTRVGYKKVRAYKVYTFSGTEKSSVELQVKQQ